MLQDFLALTGLNLFAFRFPCPVKYRVYLTGVSGNKKITKPLSAIANSVEEGESAISLPC